ncbi:MAG: M23 family metallopeptidase [Bacteroidetes bacterium]|nr:M23 family metallopeptidase [Bacteroidota bacterium]
MKYPFLCILFFVGFVSAQNIPTDYFSDPLEIPIILAGNFGELRSNHFHSGLDIKTQQKRGVPIYAPADGFVKRIKVAHFGYGKALYLTHPNGYITVYAHLQSYGGVIEDYVKEKQYEKESYTIELFPEPSLLTVSKGDIIGYTGNSGSSGGPHLHYEIRDSSSRPMNPMLFGMDIDDAKDPIVNTVMVYPISGDAQVNGALEPQKLRLKKQKDGSYRTEGIEAFGTIGVGVSTNDQHDGASNKNGAYQIRSMVNGEEKFHVHFNRFSFAETRYLNRYIDYGYYKKNKIRIQKLFRQDNNPLSIIKNEVDNGFLTMEEGYSSVYTIEIIDFKKNKTIITIPIKGAKSAIPATPEDNAFMTFVSHNQGNSITKGKFSVYIPAESLYEDAMLMVTSDVDTLKLHEDAIPLHKNMTISFDASNYTKEDMSQLYIGKSNYNKPPRYYTTYRNGKKLSAKTKTFGTYVLARDTTPPVISPRNFTDEQWISNNETLELTIEDVVSGISTYHATLNGKFILTEYDYKKDVLVYDFDDEVVKDTENKLKVIVVDNVGNSTTFEATFYRKQL